MMTHVLSRAPATTATSVSRLRTLFEGRVIAPNDAGYNEARTVFYGEIDRRPARIVRARDARDVSTVVSVARDGGLELAVRSGGHSIAGHSVTDGGIVLDLSRMQAVEVDVERRTAWAEAGLTAGEYTTAAGVHGLTTGFGDTGSVGIGGITLGGGIGFLVRKHGLTIDDLLAAEIVTADGRLLHVDAEKHPDLFWAIRGGGGNFGVATRFKFRLHEVDTAVAPMAAVEIRVLGGAMARVSDDATAFAHRGSRIMVNVAAMYERPDEAAAHEPWVEALAALRQGEGGAYVGFLRDEGEARVREAYPGATWEKLVTIKNRYDPANVFRLNHNIPPR